jgi:trans-AT polyketide synthase, acyltransferase and oxidoreductase domains
MRCGGEIGESELDLALQSIGQPLILLPLAGKPARWKLIDAAENGDIGAIPPGAAFAPALSPERLGDRSFCRDHRLRYPYVAGAMAHGIGSTTLVEAMSRGGMIGFFGAAGLPVPEVEKAIDRLTNALGPAPFGFNLIHSPSEPRLEAAIVDLYLRRGIRLVEASAYLDLTLPVVRYRIHGIYRDSAGRIVTPNRIIAKTSRVEVACKFLSPPPEDLLRVLLERGEISGEQADLARHIPMAQDITAEADSAGHTDNQPALTLLPTMAALCNRIQRQFRYDVPLRVGAAGGISTPASAAAAFCLGAAFITTGSVNQACVESGSSDEVREMLAQAGQADVMMAPSADMFEMGVKVQVLKRGTMFGMRASKLWSIYRSWNSLDEVPAEERAQLERTLFRHRVEEVWQQAVDFFSQRDPTQIERAHRDPRHKMALVFRWYLGLASHWANTGETDRRMDYQIWCGPAMGAFNEWVKGSFLEDAKNRVALTVAINILYGAAVVQRAHTLRCQGFEFAPTIPNLSPLSLADVRKRMERTAV